MYRGGRVIEIDKNVYQSAPLNKKSKYNREKLVTNKKLFLNDNLKVVVYSGYYLDNYTDPKDCKNIFCIVSKMETYARH